MFLRPALALTGDFHRKHMDSAEDGLAGPGFFVMPERAERLVRDLAFDAGFLERFLGGALGGRQTVDGPTLGHDPAPRVSGRNEQNFERALRPPPREDGVLDIHARRTVTHGP